MPIVAASIDAMHIYFLLLSRQRQVPRTFDLHPQVDPTYDPTLHTSWVVLLDEPQGTAAGVDARTADTRAGRDDAQEKRDSTTNGADGRHAGARISPQEQRRGAIFAGLREDAIDRVTRDVVYDILMDARPVGNGRCQKAAPVHIVCAACATYSIVLLRVRPLPT